MPGEIMFTGYGNCYRLDALELAAEHVRNTQHWTYKTIQHFRSILANPEFPCLFGRKAVASETCHILFARAEQLADDIAQGLADYVRTITPIPLKQRIGSPLVVFLETASEYTLAEQQALAWKVLQGCTRATRILGRRRCRPTLTTRAGRSATPACRCSST